MDRIRWIRLLLSCVVLGFFAWTSGCGTPDEEPPKKRVQVKVPDKPTYHRDVRSIIETKCQSCHQKGNIGPFTLSNFQEVSKLKGAIRHSVVTRQMPPWKADNECSSYQNNFSLTESEIKIIDKWVEQGGKEGSPSDYRKPDNKTNFSIRADVRLKLPAPYVPIKKPDDYRCFIIDWPKKKDTYVTGIRVLADNKKIAHHLIAYMIPGKYAARFQKYDKSDPGLGYSCYGGITPGESGDDALPDDVGGLGGWSPGQQGFLFPKGTGVKVPAGAKVVVQMHYNVLSKDPKSDQSVIEFQTADTVEREGYFISIADPNWISKKTMKIPANSQKTVHSFGLDVAGWLGTPFLVYRAGVHMHARGTKASLILEKGGSSKKACLLRVPKWDFNWQGDYGLSKPIRMDIGDTLRLSCEWNNSAANQPVINGKKLKSKDLNWGDGTYDEMCLGDIYVVPDY